MNFELNRTPDFTKASDGLLPAVVQDAYTQKVLMLGYMSAEAFEVSIDTGKVTFFSRSKNRLWTKGEESGHFLNLTEIRVDCDADTILVKANPQGPTCHTGDDTCWQESNDSKTAFIDYLKAVIKDRKVNPADTSYTASLFKKGINKVAQKVGEEAVEIVIEAKDNNKELFLGEAADLLFHYLVLLEAKDINLNEVLDVLISRHKK